MCSRDLWLLHRHWRYCFLHNARCHRGTEYSKSMRCLIERKLSSVVLRQLLVMYTDDNWDCTEWRSVKMVWCVIWCKTRWCSQPHIIQCVCGLSSSIQNGMFYWKRRVCWCACWWQIVLLAYVGHVARAVSLSLPCGYRPQKHPASNCKLVILSWNPWRGHVWTCLSWHSPWLSDYMSCTVPLSALGHHCMKCVFRVYSFWCQ